MGRFIRGTGHLIIARKGCPIRPLTFRKPAPRAPPTAANDPEALSSHTTALHLATRRTAPGSRRRDYGLEPIDAIAAADEAGDPVGLKRTAILPATPLASNGGEQRWHGRRHTQLNFGTTADIVASGDSTTAERCLQAAWGYRVQRTHQLTNRVDTALRPGKELAVRVQAGGQIRTQGPGEIAGIATARDTDTIIHFPL